MEPRVTIVIVTYNSAEFIGECLDSLVGSFESGFVKVILVDNGSSDGTAQLVNESYPWVEVIRSEYNGGFGAGNNLALGRLEGDYCFFLNPDARLDEGCCEKLVRFLDGRSDVGCVGPAVLDVKGRRVVSYHVYTSLYTSLWSAAGLQRIIPLNRSGGRWEVRRRPPGKPVEVDRILGAAMMIRRQALDDVGGFDERFFLFSEEEDLCLRLKHAGWKTCYYPDAQVIHRGAASIGQNAPLATAAADWSRYLYMRKHYLRFSAEISRLVWIIALFIRYLLVHLKTPDKGLIKAEGYLLSLRSLLQPGYFDRVIRPPYRSAVDEGTGD